jgi:hypothetical protein
VSRPHVLRDYAFIADGERGGLVGPEGDIAWLCFPRWDSDAVFSELIGGGGTYAVRPRGRCVWGRYWWFERARAACGGPGIYAEEYDIAQRQLRGNLPQAFVHALVLECAATRA